MYLLDGKLLKGDVLIIVLRERFKLIKSTKELEIIEIMTSRNAFSRWLIK